jgi:hypothetical protein
MVSFKIQLSTIKIRSYVLKYIKTPSKFIAIPSLHTFDVICNTIIILQYTFIYIEIVMQPLYSTPFCLFTVLFFKTVLVPYYSTKISLHLP